MGGADPGENAWISEQRQIAEEYLRRQGVDHLGVGEYPAFHIHPYVALWAVQSKQAPGFVGWWAVSGDQPTDYISSHEARNPREAVRAFSRRWHDASECMIQGEEHPECSFGPPDRRHELGDLLSRRARILHEYADLDGMWHEDGAFAGLGE